MGNPLLTALLVPVLAEVVVGTRLEDVPRSVDWLDVIDVEENIPAVPLATVELELEVPEFANTMVGA